MFTRICSSSSSAGFHCTGLSLTLRPPVAVQASTVQVFLTVRGPLSLRPSRVSPLLRQSLPRLHLRRGSGYGTHASLPHA